MEFFSCNNCKRCRRRNSSTGDDDENAENLRTISLRGGPASTDVTCCGAAVVYFYAGRRVADQPADGRSRVKFTTTTCNELTPSRNVSNNELPVLGAPPSILKNSGDSPASNSSGSGRHGGRSPSLLRSSNSVSSAASGSEKRASFNEAVDVIVADDVTGRPVVADHVRLKRAPDDDGAAAASERAARRAAAASAVRPERLTMMVYPPASRCRHAFSLASADVERRPDGSRYLRAVIRPTDDRRHEVSRSVAADERLVVRAAGKGSKLVVGAYRPEPLGDGTNYLRQYVDRFPLPHTIETKSIRADLAPTGVLVVTATINDSSESEDSD